MEPIPHDDDRKTESACENETFPPETVPEIDLQVSPKSATSEDVDRIIAEMREIRSDISTLYDLFVRRLFEDRQKSELIKTLKDASDFAFVEPFAHDLILLLDRAEKTDGEFAESVAEELEEILSRRGITKIRVTPRFDSNLQRVVRTVERDGIERNTVIGIVRNGFVFGDKVIRPAEVVLAKAVMPTREGKHETRSDLPLIDYYEILGLDRSLGLDELKQELSKKKYVWNRRRTHVDPEKATEMLLLIQKAQEVFATEALRQKYDDELDNSRSNPEIRS